VSKMQESDPVVASRVGDTKDSALFDIWTDTN
jgi:hypothetical protein